MTETVKTREMRDADLKGVLAVMRRALGESPILQRTTEAFAWKHFDNPFGKSILIVAVAGDRVVGLRAFMRWNLIGHDGTALRCVRAVDTATDPDFQRRGLFRQMTEEAVEVARGDGVHLIFNTPNDKSGAGYLSMGWEVVGPIGVMVRPGLRFLSRRAASHDDPVDWFVAGSATPKAPSIADRPALGLRTPRSPAYWAWRFGGHPSARYRQLESGSSVAIVRPNIRQGRRELILAEVLGDPRAAIHQAAKCSRSQYLAAWFSSGSPERRAAIRTGLFPIPRIHPLTLMARPLNDSQIDVSSPHAWDLSVSDLELL